MSKIRVFLLTIKSLISNFLNIRRFLKKYFRVYVFLLEGCERDSGERLTVFYGGGVKNLDYIADLVFKEPPVIQEFGAFWIWTALYLRSKKRYSDALYILDMHKIIYKIFGLNKDVFVPHWIGGGVDISEALLRVNKVHSIKQDLKKIRKNRLTYKILKKLEDFEYFYEKMHMPYIKNTYADRAFLMSHNELLERYYRNELELLLIEKDDENIAGVIIINEKSHFRAWSVGVLNGDRGYVKTGALAALYYFGLLYLNEKGIDYLHFGGSRAFLKNGPLQFKKKWGMCINDSTDTGFVIQLKNTSNSNKIFLENNPFVFCRKGLFEGATFLDSDHAITEKSLLTIKKQYLFEGMDSLNILLNENSTELIKIPNAILSRLRVISMQHFG